MHPNIRKALDVLHAPTRSPGFRTRLQWQQLRNAFLRWPRRTVALSGRTTWCSCLRCKRPQPVSVMRDWCTACVTRRPPLLLWGAELERQHEWFGKPGVQLWNPGAELDWWKVPIEPVRDGPLEWVSIEARDARSTLVMHAASRGERV